MRLKKHSNHKEKNNVCQATFSQAYLFNNSYHPCRDGGFSKILSFLEENFCRLFSAFQALGKNLEFCYFYFLLCPGRELERGFRCPGFSRFLKAFAECGRGADSPTKALGFYTPVYDRLFFSHFKSPRDVEAL